MRGMMKAKTGRIISISSVVGATGNPGQTNYAASKAGYDRLHKSLAAEVASRGLTVNVVAPGFIETPMTDVLDESQKPDCCRGCQPGVWASLMKLPLPLCFWQVTRHPILPAQHSM